jgi:hypothetical protein
MNEDLKRLIEVLNKAGYEVVAFNDSRGLNCGEVYRCTGIFELTVFDTSKDPSKS